jgi:hypothetical protein
MAVNQLDPVLDYGGAGVGRSRTMSRMTTTTPRQLVPGEHYSNWPHLKWSRARQLSSELNSRIEIWYRNVPLGLDPRIAEDGMSVTFCTRLPHSPPIFEWSLLLADILHNYRSALDALAWEMAHLDGRKPRPENERNVYFPIAITRESWVKKARGPLESVPEDILERMHSVQPYAEKPVEDGIFVHLHELDISDKHKGLIRAQVVLRDVNQVPFGIVLQDGVPLIDHLPDDFWTWLASDEPVTDGGAVFKVRTDVPIVSASCNIRLPVSIAVKNRGKQHDVMKLLVMIDKQIALTFEIIETGGLKEMPGARPTPVEHVY